MKKLQGKLLLASWLVFHVCQAELGFAPILNNGAILQCDLPVNLWGKANPGAGVVLRLDGKNIASCTADSSGVWSTVLPKQNPGGDHVIEAVSGTEAVKINKIWFGEVWLATGQSNMAQPLKSSWNGADRLQKTIPEIRFVVVPRRTGLPVEKEYTTDELAWKIFQPGNNENMASTAFYFAEQIQQATGRKVGIIQSSYGGTPCEAWTPVQALDAHPDLKYMADQIRNGVAAGRSKAECEAEIKSFMVWWRADREWKKSKKGPPPANPGPVAKGNPWSSKSPSVLYENMIAPLVPYTARGVIWYQGEANAGRPDEYRILFPAMIAAWRTAWNRPDWPFYFVQLAAYGHPSPLWKELCAAQTFTRDTVENTGMALAIDCGEEQNIHPRAKQPVGERLARLALHQVYGQAMVSRGPEFKQLEIQNECALVRFNHVDAGLKTADGKEAVPGFEVAATNRRFYPAQARIISKDTVELLSKDVPAPVFVRYAWANWPDPAVTLQNTAGLPAEPFRTAN